MLPKPPEVVEPKPVEAAEPNPFEVEPKPLVAAEVEPKPDETEGAPLLAKPLPEKPPIELIFPKPLEGADEPKVDALEPDPKVLVEAGGVVVEKRPVGTGLAEEVVVEEKRPLGTGLDEATGACREGVAEVDFALKAARGSTKGAAEVDLALKAARGSETAAEEAGDPKLKPDFLAEASASED